MYFNKLSNIPEKEIVPGFYARMVHLDHLTVAHFRVVAGSKLPEHAHPHEQVTNVLEGQLEMTVGGQTQVCTAGMSVTIPANVPHSGVALTDCRLIDVFSPARDDYR
jgi:quercetin dioxygenase-like cupin family protein